MRAISAAAKGAAAKGATAKGATAKGATVGLVVIVAVATVLPTAPALADGASGTLFSVAEVVEEVQRQLAAAERSDGPLHIDDASLDLALVEGAGNKTGGFAVPGGDFSAATREDGGRPVLRQRLVLDVAATKGAKPPGSGGGGGKLTAAIEDIRSAVQQAMAAGGAAGGGFDLKKLTLDLDFAVERDGKGGPNLVVYARDRKINAPNVQGIKVRFTDK